MENKISPPTIEMTPEQILAEMHETRESPIAKIATLENQLVGTVQTAPDEMLTV